MRTFSSLGWLTPDDPPTYKPEAGRAPWLAEQVAKPSKTNTNSACLANSDANR